MQIAPKLLAARIARAGDAIAGALAPSAVADQRVQAALADLAAVAALLATSATPLRVEPAFAPGRLRQSRAALRSFTRDSQPTR